MPAGSTYTPIQTYSVPSSTGSVTLSSIPSTYTDLILVINGTNSAGQSLQMRFNSDTGANYSDTGIYGTGSTAASYRSTSTTLIGAGEFYNYNTTTLIQVQNYSNTTTYKTALVRANSASNYVQAVVGLWRSTSAINSITLSFATSTWSVGSTFTLYGIASA